MPYKTKWLAILFVYLILLTAFHINADAATVTWNGGGSDNLASNSANWSGGILPQKGDDVVFDSTSSKYCTWDLNIILASLTKDAGYSGEVTKTSLTTLTIAKISRWIGSGSASVGANWSSGVAPQDGDIVILDDTSPNNMTWDIAGVELDLFRIESGYTGTVMLNTAVTVTGNLFVTGGTLNLNNYGLNVDGHLMINTDGTILATSSTITVKGHWVNAGTFNAGTSTVILTGTDQTITGSTTFYKLSKIATSADTLTFDHTATQTITNELKLQGVAGGLLSLRSDVDGSQHRLILQAGAQDLKYLDVKYSNALSGEALITGSIEDPNSVDSVNNDNWIINGIPSNPNDVDGDGISSDVDGNGSHGENLCIGGNTVYCDDNCMYVLNPDQSDIDNDGRGNACDVDNDNDFIVDYEEGVFGTNPLNPDTDGDGVDDLRDAFKLDAAESADSDKIEIPIITGTNNQYNLAISGDRIIWEEKVNVNNFISDIFSYDLSNNEERRITNDPSDQRSPSISGDRMVWADYWLQEDSDSYDIYLYDLFDNQKIRITTDSVSYKYDTKISGDKIVWASHSIDDYSYHNVGIYMYDLSRNEEIKIANGSNYPPLISGNVIVWTNENIDGESAIFTYNISTKKETRLTIPHDTIWATGISGDWIVFENWNYINEVIEIYVYNISTHEERLIKSGHYVWNSTIYGDIITWQDYQNGKYDIYMYDLSNPNNGEKRITTDLSQPGDASMSGDRIVWDDYRNGNGDIYMYAGDGVGDNSDNCPAIYNPKSNWTDIHGDPHTNEQPDYDLDGMGDACDPDGDADNDGMLDDWEAANGLNPLIDDSRLDPDRDGFTNIQEYQNGTDPQTFSAPANPQDADNDGILNDIDGNGISGENPCRGGNTVDCDDNCTFVSNPFQEDSDNDGYGDACTISHCVNNSLDFQDTLTDAETNGFNNLIKLVKGTYRTSENGHTPFYYYSELPHSLIIQGGYLNDCSVRDGDASSTVLDGINGDDGVLGLEEYAYSVIPAHVKLHVDGVTVMNGYYGLMMSSNSEQLEISNNIIRNNSDSALITWSDIGNTVLTNNLVFDNNTEYSGSACDLRSPHGKVYATNNTITNNNSNADGALTISLSSYDSSNAKAFVFNNIVFNNGSTDINIFRIIGSSLAAAYLYHNDFGTFYFSNINQVVQNVNINTAPLFVNEANGDYHLLPTSPLIDSGDNSAPFLPEFDFEGDNRINGNFVDIGADEYTTYDLDGDGYRSDVDCNDTNILVNPGADEVCDGIDNDCDGNIDYIGCTVIWDGSASTDWTNPLNWDSDFIPSANHTVIIPQNASVSPVLTESVEVSTLTIGTGSSLTLDGYNLTVNGDIIINGTLNASAGTEGVPAITIGGNWENYGYFIAGLSTVRLIGTGQTIYGSTTFHNFEKISDTEDTLTFEAGSTQVFTGNLILQGVGTHLLSLVGSESGMQYTIDPQSTYQISFVNMSDLLSTIQIIVYDSVVPGSNSNVIGGVPPSATTNPAGSIDGDSAVLYATVNPNASGTTVYFDWGTDTSYGNSTPGQSIGNGTGQTTVAEFITGLSPNTAYNFRVRAVNASGEVTGSNRSFTTSPISLSITFPADLNIIRPDTMVTGTIVNGPGVVETGVTVNGVVAVVYGNQFFVNHMPLIEGENTITVNAVDTAGNTAETFITVSADTTQPYVTLNSNIESGISPFDAYFSVSTSIPDSVSSYQMDGNYEGSFDVDYTGAAFDDVSFTYTYEGVYYPRILVTDSAGNGYTDTIAVVVQDKDELDALLQHKWGDMLTAMGNQDITGTLKYYTEETKQLHNDLYTALYDQLPQLALGMQAIEPVYIKENIAKYRLRQDEMYGGQLRTFTYYIYFNKDKDGIWKIYRY